MNDDDNTGVYLAVFCFFISFAVGLGVGTSTGHERACTSVKMEWVIDKCMKVTREEAK
jgi:Na+/H+ antiporter NhaC